jgi:hypothetical protein
VSSREPMKPQAGASSDGRITHSRGVIIGALLLVLGAMILALWGVRQFSTSAGDLGQLGSFFGGTVGVLLTLSSVLFLYSGLRGQQQQLQMHEVELRSQQEMLLTQTGVLRQQVFEGSFFAFLEFHRDSALTLQAKPYGKDAGESVGLASFLAAGNELSRKLGTRLGDPPPSREEIEAAFNEVCLAPHSNFGHYFRTLYYLIDYASGSPTGIARSAYMRLIRAQLSNEELLLLFFNGLSPQGRKTFKKRIEQFGLLKGLQLPAELEQLRAEYEEKAFTEMEDRP